MTIVLFLIPWYFSIKYHGIQEQYYSPSVSPLVSFLFLSLIFSLFLVDISLYRRRSKLRSLIN